MRLTAFAALGIFLAWQLWRAVGWIRIERPDVERRREAWRGVACGYRLTQPGDRRRLRIRNERIVIRRRSA